MFRVFRSKRYENKFNRLDNKEQERVAKFEQNLKIQPYSGKPLGYEFFREKKFNGKRVIFLIYMEHNAVFLVTITDKKAQQQDIDLIKANLDKYKETIKKVMEKFRSL